jgi:glycosyltransferase involved in cell wall biosynthesis
MKPNVIRLVHITTVPTSLNFFRGQVGYMKLRGIEVHAVSSSGAELETFGEREGVVVHAVGMPRRISPLRDLVALLRMFSVLRKIRPHLVHAHTPKGGLLGILGAWLARVPVRFYHIHGMPFMSAAGLKQWILRWTEKVSCRFAHRVLCVSRSVRDVAVAERICPPQKIGVLLSGSINGVDASGHFTPEALGNGTRQQVRDNHGIPCDALVIGFVGRVVRDKGVVELVEAWQVLREEFPSLHLLIVGRCEPQDPVPLDTVRVLESDARIHLSGEVHDMPPFYAAMDIVALPSYREGLPVVPLEAAAMGLPVVATRIPGCVDAVVGGETGTLVPPRDAGALAEASRNYLENPELRQRHGSAGRERVLRDFRPEAMWEAMYKEYARLLREKGISVPAAPADLAPKRSPTPADRPAVDRSHSRSEGAVRR